MNSPLPWLALIVPGICALSLLPAFLAALFFDRGFVWPYVPIGEAQKPHPADLDLEWEPPPSKSRGFLPVLSLRYILDRDRQALRSEFVPLGTFYHTHRRLYPIRYDFWMSPDRLVLAIVMGGSVISIPYFGTRLYTRLREGRCLLTVDDLRLGSSDLSTSCIEKPSTASTSRTC
jgi:hypothetical protein